MVQNTLFLVCLWVLGSVNGFLQGKLTFFGQLRGVQSLVEVEVESPVVHFYIVFSCTFTLHCQLLHCWNNVKVKFYVDVEFEVEFEV
jgi:hypothetical protein